MVTFRPSVHNPFPGAHQEVLIEVRPRHVISEIVLANHGVASAYAVLPLGAFHDEVATLRGLKLDRYAELSEIVFLTGQADLLAQFKVTDFRSIVEAQYPKRGSLIHVLNWIFAVPVLRVKSDDSTSKSMRFVIHLRVRRGIYAHEPVEAERQIVEYLHQTLVDGGCDAEIHAGMGWADFIVNGSFDPVHTVRFAELLVDIYESSFVDPETRRHPAFLRTLTLLGYRWPEEPAEQFSPPEIPQATPVMFLRAEPGHLHDALKLFAAGDSPVIDARLIDGKSDLVLLLPSPQADLLAKNLSLVNAIAAASKDESKPKLVQKLETHLIFQHLSPATAEARRSEIAESAVAPPGKCRCLKPRMVPRLAVRLPPELRNSIVNVLALFESASHDSMSCCDVAFPIRSAERGLARLTSILEEQEERRERFDREYEAAYRSDPAKCTELDAEIKIVRQQIKRQHHLFALWHLLHERVLRQRSGSSFDEMLLQSDRTVVYRGSVQKFLFLADWLMKDFFGRMIGWPDAPPLFCAMYEAERQIVSKPHIGLVQIPARHLFTLPRVIPDLWHEVGVYWFYRKVELDHYGLTVLDPERLLETLGDRYGDLVVYHHGFKGDAFRFVISMCRGWLDSHYRSNLSPTIFEAEFAALLQRIGFALDVSNRWDDVLGVTGPLDENDAWALVEELYSLVSATFGNAVPQLKETTLTSAVGSLVLELRRYGDALAKQFRDTVSPNFGTKESRQPYADFIAAYDGKMVDGSSWDLNDLFGELYWYLEDQKLRENRPTDAFAKMAGLSRSAIVECQRRQLIRR